MKKICLVLFSLFMLVACSKNEKQEQETLKIISPSGAPSLSLIEYADEYSKGNITVVEGADALSAAFLNPNPEFDMIIAPINLGATMILKKGSPYHLLGIVSWGNLYYVENNECQENIIAMFGENAVPQKVVESVDFDLSQDLRYFNAVNEVSAALLSGNYKGGILAEPVLTATLQKAKESNINLEVKIDFQEKYNQKYQTSGYPQAAVFVLKDSFENRKEEINKFVEKMQELSINSLDKIEGEESYFGVPSFQLLKKAFDKMNLHYEDAKDNFYEIKKFLSLFQLEIDEGFID